jgi:hypothetical protein
MKNLVHDIYFHAQCLGLDVIVKIYENMDFGVIFTSNPRLDYLAEFLSYFTDYNWQSYMNEIGKLEICFCNSKTIRTTENE